MRIHAFDPHTSKANGRLAITLLITPGFSRTTAGVFLAPHLGDFLHVHSALISKIIVSRKIENMQP